MAHHFYHSYSTYKTPLVTHHNPVPRAVQFSKHLEVRLWHGTVMVGYGRMWEGDPMVNLWATVRRLALLVVVSQLNGSLAAGFTQLECVSTFEGPHVHRYTRPVVLGNHHYIATRRCTMAQWHFSAQNNKNHSDTVQRNTLCHYDILIYIVYIYIHT